MMGEKREDGVLVSKPMVPPNPIAQLQLRFKELETGFQAWLAKQTLPVEAAVVTVTSSIQGAAIGGFMGTLTSDATSAFPTPPPDAALNSSAMASFQQAQLCRLQAGGQAQVCSDFGKVGTSKALSGGPLTQARNFAVMTGVNAGISCVMKRIRGKDDIETSMAAAFGSGAAYSLVSGLGGPNLVGNMVTSGLFFALFQGGLYKVGEKWKANQKPSEDLFYSRTRGMLANLGLQGYEKNFKKGLLTDSTLPLLTDSALRDVKVPPGPRLLILDHIQRTPELREKR